MSEIIDDLRGELHAAEDSHGLYELCDRVIGLLADEREKFVRKPGMTLDATLCIRAPSVAEAIADLGQRLEVLQCEWPPELQATLTEWLQSRIVLDTDR